MEIDKELIEKYHLGNCTPEEEALVNAWLALDEFDNSQLPNELHKTTDKQEIWSEISSFIEEKQISKPKISNHPIRLISKIAASLFLILTASLTYSYLNTQKEQQRLFAFDNSKGNQIKHIDSGNYSIVMAPKSNGKIDLNNSLIDFCGSILLSPKKDIVLTLQGYHDKIKLKTGQTYIVLSNTCPSSKPIVVNEKDIVHLPPVLQKHLMTHFSI